MAQTYRALAVLLSYPTAETAALMPAVLETLNSEGLAPAAAVRRLARLAFELSQPDLYDAQARYVDLFDRTRSLSLQLYEHVHGEGRARRSLAQLDPRLAPVRRDVAHADAGAQERRPQVHAQA